MINIRLFIMPAVILASLACSGQNTNKVKSNNQDLKLSETNAQSVRKSTIAKWSVSHMSKLAADDTRAYDLMQISKDFGALLAMYEYTDSVYYLEDAFKFTLGLIGKAQEGRHLKGNPSHYRDNYRGWANANKNVKAHRNGGNDGKEIVLFESYFLRYASKMLYLAKRDNLTSSSKIINANYSEILRYIEKDGWEKWYNRGLADGGCFRYLFRNRTHMTSHWAMVALFLSEIGENRSQFQNYSALLNMYDKQLRGNMKVTDKGAYIWNMTWDNSWPFGLNCNPPASTSIVQDVDHGNHVVAYIVEAFEMHHEWNAVDIQRLVKTVKTILFNAKERRFYSSLDKKKGKYYTKGIRMADGFLKLCRYDNELLGVFKTVKNANEKSSKLAFNKLQYQAELLLAESYHN